MKFLVFKGASEFWVQGDDGQLMELTNVDRFEIIYEGPGIIGQGPSPFTSVHLELKYLDIDYVDSLPVKEKPTTDIRKRKLR